MNRDPGTASIFSVVYSADGPPTLAKIVEIPVCAEPWEVVIHPNGDDAFVVCRKDQSVAKISGLKSTPALGTIVKVGSEPTGIALTAVGTTAYVPNWVDGTVSAINTATMQVSSTIDLNAVLAASPYLGTGVVARPGLAHPRSVAVTNNGNPVENDDTLLVTEYFAQQKVPVAADGSNADVAKVGVLYKIPLDTKTASIIELPPMTDMGFLDHKGAKAGCYPNQTQSITTNGAFAFVTSICASPKGPLGVFTQTFPACPGGDTDCKGAAVGRCNATALPAAVCKTNCLVDTDCGAVGGTCNLTTNVCAPNVTDVKTARAPAVTIVDIGGGTSVATVSLNKAWSDFIYTDAARGVPDTNARRFPLLANSISFVPGTSDGYVTAGGADAVFHVAFNSTYQNNATIDNVGDTGVPFINLAPTNLAADKSGHIPIGIVVANDLHAASTTRFAFVASDGARNLTAIDLKKSEVAGLSTNNAAVVSSSPLPTDPAAKMIADGKALFQTGLGRWSLNGQAWGACAECHIDGLTDNITWFFGKGPRQTISVDGAFSKTGAVQRTFGWNASFDETSDLDVGVFRNQLAGVGGIVSDPALANASRIDVAGTGHSNLAGSSLAAANPANPANLASACVIDDWSRINAYAKSIRTPKKPSGLDAAQVAAGQALFTQGNCQGCHSGDRWSISTLFYTPDPLKGVDGPLKSKSWATAVTSAAFPTALLPTTTAANQVMRYNGTNAASFDSLFCVLRPVGTYNLSETQVGGAELRSNMTAIAQGKGDQPQELAAGYSPPSLLGLSVGAPFFHGGGARTLEAALSDLFKTHHQAFTASFLDASDAQRATKVAQLVQFLLSIDSETATIATPALGPTGGAFCTYP